MINSDFFQEPANAMLCVGFFGMVCYLVLVINMFIGGDADDLGDMGDSEVSFLNLSFGGMFSFLMGWGFLSNLLIEKIQFTNVVGILLGVLGGGVLTFLHGFLRTLVKKAEHRVETPVVEEGETGVCYLRITPEKRGMITIRGRQVDAISDEEIESHQAVRVVKQARLDEVIKVSKA